MKRFFLAGLLIALLTTSCMQSSNAFRQTSLLLNTFTENDVTVSLRLEVNEQGRTILSAAFIPPDNYHLYSKDIPVNGLDGLGRPTLLEIPVESRVKSTGKLMENVQPQIPDFEPKELLIYPAGEVILSLEVELPDGNEWLDDSIRITYMACSDNLCKPPVVGKIVPVRIPSINAISTP